MERRRTALYVTLAAVGAFILGVVAGGWGFSRAMSPYLNTPLLTHHIASALDHWSTIDDLNKGRIDKALWSLNLSLDADIVTIDGLITIMPDSADAATGANVLRTIAAQRKGHPSIHSEVHVQNILARYPKKAILAKKS